ncbi:hypothetical protein F5148DRAFT_10100 [Russula earlei]|uniref:Uncharacterized protein n=1 Tax=Russula earlei TaxID=71964 RepID=A0ACC0UR09_9AGAM|nr:hypothetical protein F5148DRAFT_10100 [Russula earlei]
MHLHWLKGTWGKSQSVGDHAQILPYSTAIRQRSIPHLPRCPRISLVLLLRTYLTSTDYRTSLNRNYTLRDVHRRRLPPHFSIPPSMPPPQAPLMRASPSYASVSGSGSSSQSSPAYSQGPIPSPHAFGPPGQELYSVQAPATPSYDSPLASLGMTVADPNVHRVPFPQQSGTVGLQNLSHSFGPGPQGLLPTSTWQPDGGYPSRQNAGDGWQVFGKFHH